MGDSAGFDVPPEKESASCGGADALYNEGALNPGELSIGGRVGHVEDLDGSGVDDKAASGEPAVFQCEPALFDVVPEESGAGYVTYITF